MMKQATHLSMFDLVVMHAGLSQDTLGPDGNYEGIVEHLYDEVDEVDKSEGKDPREWADIILLAIDGASRSGISASQLCHALLEKHYSMGRRDWPKSVPGKATKHLKGDASPILDYSDYHTLYDAAPPAKMSDDDFMRHVQKQMADHFGVAVENVTGVVIELGE